jgi:hypothetical protein
MSLAKFVEQQNKLAEFMASYGGKGLKTYDVKNLTAEDKKDLADCLASALSPENLCCDGELRGAKLQAKAKILNNAKKELEGMGVTHDWW